VRLAEEARQWVKAERLQRVCVDWDRQRAAPALATPPGALDGAQRNAIRTLAVSVSELGNILREQGKAECVVAYEEDYDLSLRIDDKPGAAVTAFNLGKAYGGVSIPAIRDLTQAERWYRRGLELCDEHDLFQRGGGLAQLGLVAYERFKEARAANKSEEKLLHNLNAAVEFYHQALDMLPSNAVDRLAVTHNQLGNIYRDAGDLTRALSHWQETIRYFEAAGNLYNAATARRNVALALAQAGRLADAREYARAALRNFQTYGDRAAAEIQETQELIAAIEEAMSET